MPHITERAPNVSTPSVYPYSRASLQKKTTAGQTDKQTYFPKQFFSTF